MDFQKVICALCRFFVLITFPYQPSDPVRRGRAFFVSPSVPLLQFMLNKIIMCFTKVSLQNVAKFTQKHLCWSLFLMKLDFQP